MKYLILTISAAAAMTACTSTQKAPEQPAAIGMANPASQYCVQAGGTLRIENTATGQVGFCRFSDGTEVEEWTLFRSAKQGDATANVNVVDYACGPDMLRVHYFIDEEKAVLERANAAIELQQQRSASGFIYSNGPNTIRGKGDDLTVEIGRMVPLQCKAKKS